MADERRILSITAAPGWGALFDEDDEDVYIPPRLVTLAAWALVEEPTGEQRLVGMVQKPADDDSRPGEFVFADAHPGFTGYSNQGLKVKGAD